MKICQEVWPVGKNEEKADKMFVGHAPDYIASPLTPAVSRSSLRSSSDNWLIKWLNVLS